MVVVPWLNFIEDLKRKAVGIVIIDSNMKEENGKTRKKGEEKEKEEEGGGEEPLEEWRAAAWHCPSRRSEL